jgi:hypothetical protein
MCRSRWPMAPGAMATTPTYDPATTARGDAFRGPPAALLLAQPRLCADRRAPGGQRHLARRPGPGRLAQPHRRPALPPAHRGRMGIRLPRRHPHALPPRRRPGRTLVQHANLFDQAAAPYWPRWSQHALPGSDGHAFTAPWAAMHPTPSACTTCWAMCGNGCLTGMATPTTPSPHATTRKARRKAPCACAGAAPGTPGRSMRAAAFRNWNEP